MQLGNRADARQQLSHKREGKTHSRYSPNGVLTAPREASRVAPSLGRVEKCVFKATAYKLDQVLQPVGDWLRDNLPWVSNTI